MTSVYPIDPTTGRASLGGRVRRGGSKPPPSSATGPVVRIYLAGKITKNGWRTQFVPTLREAGGTAFDERHPDPVDLGNGIIYNGPFFVSCDHGCAHGGTNNHAMLDGGCIECVQGEGWRWKHGGDDDQVRDVAVRRCLDQIGRSDLILAVVKGDAHGTLVEIGYAVGIGKKVIAAASADCGCVSGRQADDDDFMHDGAWFPFHLPNVGAICCIAGAMAKLEADLGRSRLEVAEESRCESPVELAFLRSMRKHRQLWRFKPNVTVLDGKYRIDFADTKSMIGIEIDGHQYHSDKETFAKDRVRQRELEKAGWRIVRYSGQEVHRDADSCVADLRTWLAATA